MKYVQWDMVHSHVQWGLYNHLQFTYISLPLCVCAAGSLLLRYTWRHPRCCILRSRIFFFSWPLSTVVVNTNKYGRTWEHTINAYMLWQTFRRPERLACDLNQLGRSVKQVPSDDETFLSWVVSRDTSKDIYIRWVDGNIREKKWGKIRRPKTVSLIHILTAFNRQHSPVR